MIDFWPNQDVYYWVYQLYQLMPDTLYFYRCVCLTMSVDQVSRLSVLCNVLAWFFLSFLRNKMNISPFSYLDASSRQNGFQRTHKQTIHSEITGEFFLPDLRMIFCFERNSRARNWRSGNIEFQARRVEP